MNRRCRQFHQGNDLLPVVNNSGNPSSKAVPRSDYAILLQLLQIRPLLMEKYSPATANKMLCALSRVEENSGPPLGIRVGKG